MQCPDLQTLDLVAQEQTDPGTAMEVREHCANCATCRQNLADVTANRALEDSLRSMVQQAGQLPSQVGEFEVLRELGRGAMGVVLLARQQSPRRQVALKLLPAVHATTERRRRFADEVELLGRLRHPGIAQIYEAGIAEIGMEQVPYFAMEHVNGSRLDRFIEESGWGEEQRVELVARIADAVHHAHGRGVLHRDLKPGNILIDTTDGAPRPKVLDFGVARTLDRYEREGVDATRVGQLVGTLPFMSPEQVGEHPEDLDARSDVYALGVLAFLVLSGRHPLDLEGCAALESVRRIREQDPVRLEGDGFRVRADVATVVQTALRKDPAQRYQSASEFAADLRRALRNEPIAARPLRARYQLAKLIQRHRLAFAAGVTAVLVAASLSVVLLVFYQRARDSEQLARVEARSAQSVADFLYDIFGQAVPRTRGPDDVTARELIEVGIERVESLEAEPEVRGRLLFALGSLCRELAMFEPGQTLLEQSLEARREAYGENHEQVARSIDALGRLAFEQGDFQEAEKRFHEAVRVLRVAGGTDQVVASSLNYLGMSLTRQARYEDAVEILKESMSLHRRLFGADHDQVATVANNLAVVYTQLGRFDDALPVFEETHAILKRRLGEDDVRVGSSHANLGALRMKTGAPAAAEPHFRKALAIQRAVLGDAHPNVAGQWHRLGLCLLELDRMNEAEEAVRTALAIREAATPEHWFTAESASVLGQVLARQGRSKEAEPLLRRGAEGVMAARGSEDPFAVRARERLERFLESGGR